MGVRVPSFVRQVMLWELVKMVAVKVVLLLPPGPTIIKLEKGAASVDLCGHVRGNLGRLGKNLPGLGAYNYGEEEGRCAMCDGTRIK